MKYIMDVAARLREYSIPEPNTGCHLWIGYVRPNGYGEVTGAKGQSRYAHRVAYEAFIGPIPAGMDIDHKCRVLSCINTDHLEAVTHRENVLRGVAPSAQHALATHCPRGHAYSGQNLYVWKGARQCRICKRLNWQAWFKRQTITRSGRCKSFN